MEGYWKKKSETDEIIKDRWLYTGNIGVIDNDGFIRSVDEKKRWF